MLAVVEFPCWAWPKPVSKRRKVGTRAALSTMPPGDAPAESSARQVRNPRSDIAPSGT